MDESCEKFTETATTRSNSRFLNSSSRDSSRPVCPNRSCRETHCRTFLTAHGSATRASSAASDSSRSASDSSNSLFPADPSPVPLEEEVEWAVLVLCVFLEGVSFEKAPSATSAAAAESGGEKDEDLDEAVSERWRARRARSGVICVVVSSSDAVVVTVVVAVQSDCRAAAAQSAAPAKSDFEDCCGGVSCGSLTGSRNSPRKTSCESWPSRTFGKYAIESET